jgi:electron transport complex protein RnfC
MEGSFERLGKREEIFSWTGMSGFEMQRVISDCGVVEMEGSGKPLSEMLSAFRNAPEPLTLVVRCVFDDPWLAADYVLCKERLKEVAEGSVIMARALIKVSRILFAVSCTEKKLGDALLAEASRGDIPVSMALVGSRYPQKNRRELEQVLRNYGKDEGVELGSLLILGPATLAAVHDAVKYKKPALDRYITVGGSAVRKPQVLKARIGTRLAEIFAECGGFTGLPERIAVGSPLQGRVVANLNEPVTKTSYAIFAALKGQAADGKRRDCISCGECRSVCPVGLDPEELYKLALMQRLPEAVKECHGCGCCELVCPSHLPLATILLEKSRMSHG